MERRGVTNKTQAGGRPSGSHRRLSRFLVRLKSHGSNAAVSQVFDHLLTARKVAARNFSRCSLRRRAPRGLARRLHPAAAIPIGHPLACGRLSDCRPAARWRLRPLGAYHCDLLQSSL